MSARDPAHQTRHWDIFCRVVDNLGDVGFCWRLSCDLAARGHTVRLWVDDARALAWMAPAGAHGVQVHAWPDNLAPWLAPAADVVIEAFGCDLPPAYLQQMANRTTPPVWINLEYLSAEPYVARCHGLPSPQMSGPAAGLTKHFFFPGFTPDTGGLLRETGLRARQQTFDANAWLAEAGIQREPGERLVSLFAYNNPALPQLLAFLAEESTRLIVTAGSNTAPITQWFSQFGHAHPLLKLQPLAPLSQTDYDHLLWACDLNLVRGEDSFVRAHWAARPFIWQIYPQQDGAHAAKLQAFLDHFLQTADPALRAWISKLHRVWNGLSEPTSWPAGPAEMASAWATHCQVWCAQVAQQDDLTSQLIRFTDSPAVSPGTSPWPEHR